MAVDGSGPLLSIANLEVAYHDTIQVLRGVSLDVPSDAVVAVLGANGAGKTTLLRAVSGLLGVHEGRVTRGRIDLGGESLLALEPTAIVRRGIAQVMEGRRIFPELTVDQNLQAGAYTRRDRGEVRESFERVMSLFPVLAERRTSVAGYLSGGEQQMVAIARALMARPTLLLLDEPSLGLAPRIVEQIRDIVVEINRAGTSVLLIEQNAAMALSIAHHGYVLENGRIVRDGPGSELIADSDIQEFYLGVGEAGRHSFRELKTYRRKKRWSA